MAQHTAVVIGINYTQFPQGLASAVTEKAGLNPLRFAEADAEEMAAELEAAKYKVAFLSGTAATHRAIVDTIVRQRRVAGPDGFLLIYFSGHGDVDPDDRQIAYLLPVDADPE